MNPLVGESKNLLTAGKVVGQITDPSDYRSETAKRGEPDYVIGRSSLMEFAWCPKRWIDGYEGEETKATEWGDLLDCLFLTPWQFKSRYSVSPENYSSKGMECPSCGSVTDSKTCRKCATARIEVVIKKPWDKHAEYCSDWELEQGSKKIIKSKLFGPACDAVKVLEANPEVGGIRMVSKTQTMATASYFDDETGVTVPLKILIDLLPQADSIWGKALCDLKSSESAAMRPWRAKCKKYHYDAQAALYLDVWTATTGEDRTDFLHIVQESYSPYQTELRMMSAEFIEIGRADYQKALKKYCQCLKTGIWPGYEGSHLDWRGWQLTEPEPWMVQ